MVYNIATFGQAEKGRHKTAYFCQTLSQLANNLGNPPQESLGLEFAIQAIMFKRNVIFFRVHEEGFQPDDYYAGLDFLKNKNLINKLNAICLPGVGNAEILAETTRICSMYNSLLIINEADLYDYLTYTSRRFL